ncbi:MAG: hypothetical protein ACRD2B_07125 [Terriglobia bacterium]
MQRDWNEKGLRLENVRRDALQGVNQKLAKPKPPASPTPEFQLQYAGAQRIGVDAEAASAVKMVGVLTARPTPWVGGVPGEIGH